MKIITSATNVLRGLQNLSADEKYVIKADGSGLQKMSGWQSFKDFLGTRGAIRENRATIAALKGLIQNDPKYRGSSAGLIAQLDKLSASGLSVSGKFIKTMFTSLNAKTNLDIVRRAVANRLATIMADVSEGGEKTPLQKLLDKAYGCLGTAMPKNDFQKALKKCVESQLTNELAQKLIADGTLPKGKDLSSVSMVLERVLEHVLTGMEDVSEDDCGTAEDDCGTELLARLKEQTVQDSTFEENLAEFFHRDDKVGFSTEASFGFSPPEALLNHEALENFNVSKVAFSRVYTLERQLGKTDEDIEKALVDPSGIPNLLRLAHNPQFLTDRTAYLKGKAILEYDSGESDPEVERNNSHWSTVERARLQAGFYKQTMGDAGLNGANYKLAQQFGMDVNGAPFKAVVEQLTRMSTHLAFGVFTDRLKSAATYHVGKRPKDSCHPDVHLAAPPMGDLGSFAIEKGIDQDILNEVLDKMKNANWGELADKKKAVFVARVFNQPTLTELWNSKSVDVTKENLKRDIAACFEEAQAVVEAFKDDDAALALDAFCLQMNYGSTLKPGKPLNREMVAELKAELETVKAWAQPLLAAGRPPSTNDLINLCDQLRCFTALINDDPEESKMVHLPEMALGMYKTMSMRGKAGGGSAWETIFQPKHLDRLIEGCAQFWDGKWREFGGRVNNKTLTPKDFYAEMCKVCNQTRAYLVLVRHLGTIAHSAMGCDEGQNWDVHEQNQQLIYGMTVNTMKLPMPDCTDEDDIKDVKNGGGNALDSRVFGLPALAQRVDAYKNAMNDN